MPPARCSRRPATPTGWSCRSWRRTSTPPTPWTTSCPSSPTSASRSTSRPSSSRRGSTRCTSTTTTTSPSSSTSSPATSTTTPTPSTTGCTTARRCRICSARRKTTPDPEEFVELRRQAAALIAEEAPAVWLLLYNDVTVARAGLSGLPDVRCQRPLRRLRHHRGELTISLAARSACPPTSQQIG